MGMPTLHFIVFRNISIKDKHIFYCSASFLKIKNEKIIKKFKKPIDTAGVILVY